MFVPQVLRNSERAALLQIFLRGEQSGVGRVALRRGGQIDRRMGEGDLRFGQPHEFAGLLRGDRHEQRARVGQTDVLACGDDEPTRDETDVFSCVEHFCQPVEGCIGIASPDAFDECADRVVVGIVLRIVDHRLALDAVLDDFPRDVDRRAFAVRSGQGRELQRIEAAPCVAVADLREMRRRSFVQQHFFAAQAAFCIGQGALHDSFQVGRGKRPQFEYERAGDQWAVDVEKRVHRCRPDEAHRAALHVRKQHILLCFVEPVDLVDEEYRPCPVAGQPLCGGSDGFAQLRHVALHSAQALETGFRQSGDDLGKARFARSRRTIKDNGGKAVALDRPAQQLAGAENVFLPGIFAQVARAHPFGQGHVSRCGCVRLLFAEEIVHRFPNLAWPSCGARRILVGHGN